MVMRRVLGFDMGVEEEAVIRAKADRRACAQIRTG